MEGGFEGKVDTTVDNGPNISRPFFSRPLVIIYCTKEREGYEYTDVLPHSIAHSSIIAISMYKTTLSRILLRQKLSQSRSESRSNHGFACNNIHAS